MGTRSHVAYKKPDGTIKFMYHHWDGYIKNLGNILNESLNDEGLVEKIFRIDTHISSTLKMQYNTERITDKNKENRLKYIKELTETRNHQVGDLFIKYSKFNFGYSGQCKNKKELLDNCQEQYIYLYENKKWKVKAYFSEYFIDLSFAVKVNDLLEGIIEIIRQEKEEREKGKFYKIDKMLDFNQQKINKSYDFMTTKRTPKQDIFMKEMLNSKEDKEFADLVEVLAQTKKIMLLNEKIEKDLPEKITKNIRIKI